MDSTSVTIIVVIALFALIVVASFLVYRSRTRVRIKGPLGTSLELDAEQDKPQGPQTQKMVKSESGEQEMKGQGGAQSQEMEDSPHGKQKMG